LLDQRDSSIAHHIEHILARQHGGTDDLDNLALACHRCNLCKGPNLSGLDPLTMRLVPLFHPRRDKWDEHFTLAGAAIEGISATGRTTVHVLAVNDARRVELRTQILAREESS
jgi:hypothetical protein